MQTQRRRDNLKTLAVNERQEELIKWPLMQKYHEKL